MISFSCISIQVSFQHKARVVSVTHLCQRVKTLRLPRPSWRTCWKVLQSRGEFRVYTSPPAAQRRLSITELFLNQLVASLPHISAPCLSVWRYRCAFLPVALTSHFKTRLLRSGSPGSVVHSSIQILRKTVAVLWSVFGRDLNQCTPHSFKL